MQEYAVAAILILVVAGMAGAILLLTHLIGPRRHGPIKDMPYESGMDPIGDARRRFNVRFYLVAMLFLLFDVEIVFFYPWAVLFPRLSEPVGSAARATVAPLAAAGFGSPFLLIEMSLFVGILVVGYVYAWRKGAFEWN